MAETIDAIEEKLNPQRIVNDAKQAVRDATVGKVTTMMNTVTEKATDVGERRRARSRRCRGARPATHAHRRRWMGEARGTLIDRAQETAQQAVEKVGEVADQVQQSTGDARHAASDAGEQSGGPAREPEPTAEPTAEPRAGSTSQTKTSRAGSV